MLTRRETIRLMGGATAGLALGGCATSIPDQSAVLPLAPDQQWLAKLGHGLPTEYDYMTEIEGRLPQGLSGTLYRNGPGLFERDGYRRWSLIRSFHWLTK
jgi:all-trans-8'-apo-beta-carotenal 15,15'-oxygenase